MYQDLIKIRLKFYPIGCLKHTINSIKLSKIHAIPTGPLPTLKTNVTYIYAGRIESFCQLKTLTA